MIQGSGVAFVSSRYRKTRVEHHFFSQALSFEQHAVLFNGTFLCTGRLQDIFSFMFVIITRARGKFIYQVRTSYNVFCGRP